MSTPIALLISAGLLAVNAFFVAAEFALVASKRHRLEQAAAEGSRSARAAIAGVSELSLMLAGAQLGITLCTLGLGALAEPAVAHLLDPLFEAIGIPSTAAHVIAFLLAVGGIGLIHVVVGEMAPKSWAISHPEASALRLAIPFRAFTRVFRPVLVGLNALANVCLRLVKVTPQAELANAHGPEELRILIESSRQHGTLAEPEHALLTAMLALQNTTVDQVMIPTGQITAVAADTPAREIELTSRQAGRSRLAVNRPNGEICGFVHVRDAVRATTFPAQLVDADAGAVRAGEMMTDAYRLPGTTPVAGAIRLLREQRCQLAVVTGPDGSTTGIVALEDLLEEVIGEFDDETDPVVAAARLSAQSSASPTDQPGN
ncbi:hemolysin family protein [Kribbella sp. NBC_01245]|uniref:hemolysin family protein n=1 Tax=Kribbella sp. NBC_01245 TaxID=2903578 RepID=UPI002E2BCEFF|nr:hemolysin family protein [Kribbella sp. NBC_01245]